MSLAPLEAPGPAVRAELARAKVNLTLHVTGRREDGYHLLDSLVVFPQIGDRLAVEHLPADAGSARGELPDLRVEGPFARDLDGPAADNLILKAARSFAERTGRPLPALRLTLTKRLPVASGIGGGSTNAATALRLLQDVTEAPLPEDALTALALSLGADVPVCLWPGAQRMRGIGDLIDPGPELPDCAMVLVNPKATVSTPDIFRALDRRDNAPMAALPEQFGTLAELSDFLGRARNDLQDAAISLCPAIGEVMTALRADQRIIFARMSGSGATCFGLCEREEARDIERALRGARPDWWIASGPLA